MHELILSRMMRISRGTYYSGSWSSTACIFQISLHPRLELNPSSPGAGRPTHQPRASGITVCLAWLGFSAWLGLFIDFTHKLTINPLNLYERLKEQMGGGSKTPFFDRRKDQPITFLLQYFFQGTVSIISSVCLKIDNFELLFVYESDLWIFAVKTRKNLANLTPAIFFIGA